MELISRAAAKECGLMKYYTGKPCARRGHLSYRLVSNTKCCACNTADRADWGMRNAQRVIELRLRFEANNPESLAAAKRRYREANREKLRDANRRYYQENRKDILRKGAEIKSRNYAQVAERMRRYNEENRGRVAALAAKYRAAKLKATPTWADLEAMRLIYERASAEGMEVDHEIPLQGKLVCGLHVPNNLRILPRSENRKKSAKFDPNTWVEPVFTT